MITGDQTAIGRETARRLGMGLNFHDASVVRQNFVEGIPIHQIVEEADGFGAVLPCDKPVLVLWCVRFSSRHTYGFKPISYMRARGRVLKME